MTAAAAGVSVNKTDAENLIPVGAVLSLMIAFNCLKLRFMVGVRLRGRVRVRLRGRVRVRVRGRVRVRVRVRVRGRVTVGVS